MRSLELALALLLSASACRPRELPNDAWFAAPPTYGEPGASVDPKHVAKVGAGDEAAAEGLLASRSWVALADAPSVPVPPGLTAPPGTQLYLLRGLVLAGTEGTGRFSVWQAPTGEVRVNWGCLGTGTYPMQRQTLVVALPAAPTAVHVTTSMAS